MRKPQAKEEKVKDRSSMAVTTNPYNELEETEAAKEKKTSQAISQNESEWE